MKYQLPQERINNFFEVALGFSKEEAEKEAARCLNCKVPACVKGCPVEIDIPAFITLIKDGKISEALLKIKEKNSLPAVCGRVCPQENQCEEACILNKKKVPIYSVKSNLPEVDTAAVVRTSNGVNIGALERFAADNASVTSYQSPVTRKKDFFARIAVVGSGPAGLTVAGELAKIGYFVTLFESLHVCGGVLSYGIPEFRLPKKIVAREVSYIESLGVEIKTNVLVGRTVTFKDLFSQGYNAIFIGAGAGLPQFLGIPGENLPGVYSANEFLTRINLMKAYNFPEYYTPLNLGKRVVVVGAGNVAFDCARCAIRLGSRVTLVYRRSETEMPARKEEVVNAKEEGLNFSLLTQPIRILANKEGFVAGLECIKMQLGEPDASGRRRPKPIPDSNFILDIDTVIVAIGQNPNPLLVKATPELKVNSDGTIVVDDNFRTSIDGVFAGGDITTGADTVISAMGAGKRAAREINKYIQNKPK